MRTWHGEMAFVGVALAGVAIASGGGFVELLGATAVLLTFGHASVSERLREREAARLRPSVDCHRWATRYFISKEAIWFAYFVLHRSWAALAGVLLFLLYPSWRRLWRRHHPLAAELEPVAPDVGGDGSPYRTSAAIVEPDRLRAPPWARPVPMPGPPERRRD